MFVRSFSFFHNTTKYYRISLITVALTATFAGCRHELQDSCPSDSDGITDKDDMTTVLRQADTVDGVVPVYNMDIALNGFGRSSSRHYSGNEDILPEFIELPVGEYDLVVVGNLEQHSLARKD